MELIMLIWTLSIMFYYFSDVAVNYMYYYLVRQKGETEEKSKAPPTNFMTITYWIVAAQFLILTVLIV